MATPAAYHCPAATCARSVKRSLDSACRQWACLQETLHVLIAFGTRSPAQTNTTIKIYQRKTHQISARSFLLSKHAILPASFMSSHACIAFLSKAFFEQCNLATLLISANPWALKGPRSVVKCFQIMKSNMVACTCNILFQPNRSHIDVLIFPLQSTAARHHILVSHKA